MYGVFVSHEKEPVFIVGNPLMASRLADHEERSKLRMRHSHHRKGRPDFTASFRRLDD